jgi:hypothetical protein
MTDRDINERDVWLAAYLAVAGASNCGNMQSPIKWADSARKAFNERFPDHD